MRVSRGSTALSEFRSARLHARLVARVGSVTAVQARLQAERTGAAHLAYPKFLTERSAQPLAVQAMTVQQQLFATRRAALEGEVGILAESLNGLARQLDGLQARDAANAQQSRLYGDELAAIKPLFDQGFVPRQRVFELERALAAVEGQRNEDQASAGRVRSMVSEARLRMAQAREAFRKEVETQLTEVQRQVNDLTERRVATLDELERVVLKAPEAGNVVELAVHTVGGVAAPGHPDHAAPFALLFAPGLRGSPPACA